MCVKWFIGYLALCGGRLCDEMVVKKILKEKKIKGKNMANAESKVPYEPFYTHLTHLFHYPLLNY